MDASPQNVLDYFSGLGFIEIPIEDELTAWSYEYGPDGEYALITDEDGLPPNSLELPLVLAFYTPEGSYLWSTGFKNAAQFQEVWSRGDDYAAKQQAAQEHRDQLASEFLRFAKPNK